MSLRRLEVDPAANRQREGFAAARLHGDSTRSKATQSALGRHKSTSLARSTTMRDRAEHHPPTTSPTATLRCTRQHRRRCARRTPSPALTRPVHPPFRSVLAAPPRSTRSSPRTGGAGGAHRAGTRSLRAHRTRNTRFVGAIRAVRRLRCIGRSRARIACRCGSRSAVVIRTIVHGARPTGLGQSVPSVEVATPRTRHRCGSLRTETT